MLVHKYSKDQNESNFHQQSINTRLPSNNDESSPSDTVSRFGLCLSPICPIHCSYHYTYTWWEIKETSLDYSYFRMVLSDKHSPWLPDSVSLKWKHGSGFITVHSSIPSTVQYSPDSLHSNWSEVDAEVTESVTNNSTHKSRGFGPHLLYSSGVRLYYFLSSSCESFSVV